MANINEMEIMNTEDKQDELEIMQLEPEVNGGIPNVGKIAVVGGLVVAAGVGIKALWPKIKDYRDEKAMERLVKAGKVQRIDSVVTPAEEEDIIEVKVVTEEEK